MADKVEIYSLSCPASEEVRYIGKANNARSRLSTHLRDMYRRDYPLYRWMRKLHASGHVPIVKVVAICTTDNWREVEKETILKFKDEGARLLNVAEGGDEPFCSAGQRALNGAKVANAIHHGDSLAKKLWEVKRNMGSSLKWLLDNGRIDAYNRVVEKLKKASQLNPALFSEYRNLKAECDHYARTRARGR